MGLPPLVAATGLKAVASGLSSIFGANQAKQEFKRNKMYEKKIYKRDRRDRKEDESEIYYRGLTDQRADESRIYERGRLDTQDDQLDQFAVTRDAAIRGGFNPLSALGMGNTAGGGGLSGSISGPSGSINASGGARPVYAAPLSSIDLMADSMRSFGEIATGVTSQQQADYDLQRELAEIEVEQARNDLEHRPRLTTQEPTEGSEGLLDPGRSTFTETEHLDSGRYNDPHSIDAEMAEARRGEIGEAIQSVKNSWNDTLYDNKMQGIVRQYGRDAADLVHQHYASTLEFTIPETVRKLEKEGLIRKKAPLKIEIPVGTDNAWHAPLGSQ